MSNKTSNNNVETRQERRERKVKKQREQIAQHGRSLARIYKEAILKRLKRSKIKKQQS